MFAVHLRVKAAPAIVNVLPLMNKACIYLISFLMCSICFAEPIHIAVASNFRPTLELIIAQYQNEHEEKITLSSASTGVLAAQITQGAPFDLLFAADAKIPQKLAKTLKLDPAVTYAVGSLAFWCPQGAPQTREELGLWRSDVAIASSQHAPYGAAAEQVIDHLAWPENTRIVTATNIAQVSLFVSSHAASCGFVARSLLPDATAGAEVFYIPTQWHEKIEQQAINLNPSNSTASDFLNYVLTDAQTILTLKGYQGF